MEEVKKHQIPNKKNKDVPEKRREGREEGKNRRAGGGGKRKGNQSERKERRGKGQGRGPPPPPPAEEEVIHIESPAVQRGRVPRRAWSEEMEFPAAQAPVVAVDTVAIVNQLAVQVREEVGALKGSVEAMVERMLVEVP